MLPISCVSFLMICYRYRRESSYYTLKGSCQKKSSMDRRPCHPMGLLGLVQNTEVQFGSERSQDDRPHTAIAAPIPNQEGCSGIQVLNSSVVTNPMPITAQQQSYIRPRAWQSLSLTIQSQPAHAQAIPSASACSAIPSTSSNKQVWQAHIAELCIPSRNHLWQDTVYYPIKALMCVPIHGFRYRSPMNMHIK